MGIFVSYRRSDTAYVAMMVRDRLASELGASEVYMDVDSIPLGVDFRNHIHEALNNCQLVLAIIGKDWIGPSTLGKKRIDNPEDYVRLEIGVALSRGISIIPVLVDSASIPEGEVLPATLGALRFRQSASLQSGPHLRRQLEALCIEVARQVRGSEGKFVRSAPGARFAKMATAMRAGKVVGILCSAAAAVASVAYLKYKTQDEASTGIVPVAATTASGIARPRTPAGSTSIPPTASGNASSPTVGASASQALDANSAQLRDKAAADGEISAANIRPQTVQSKELVTKPAQPREKVSVWNSHGFVCNLRVDRAGSERGLSTLVKYCQRPLSAIPADRLWDTASLTGVEDTAFVWKDGRVAIYSQPLDKIIFEFRGAYDGIRLEFGHQLIGSPSTLSSYYYKVKVGSKWGVLSNDGTPIIAPKYDYIGLMKRDPGRFWTVRIGALWGMLDEAGQELLAIKYESVNPNYPLAERSGEFTANVKLDGKRLIVNRAGIEVGSWQEKSIPAAYG